MMIMIIDILLQVLTLVSVLLLSLAVTVHADSAIFIALEAFSEYISFGEFCMIKDDFWNIRCFI
jgi:hypothetical protein